MWQVAAGNAVVSLWFGGIIAARKTVLCHLKTPQFGGISAAGNAKIFLKKKKKVTWFGQTIANGITAMCH